MTRKEALKLVTTEYYGLNKVEKKYKNDYEIVKKAVTFWPYQIRYASNYLKTNKELGLIAVKEDGLLIKELEYNLKNDNDIILAALKQDGTAIQYLDPNKKRNKEYIDIAIKSNPFSICHIDTNLITIEQAKYCLSLDPFLIDEIYGHLRNNPELIKLVDKLDSRIHLDPSDKNRINEMEDPFAQFGELVEYKSDEEYCEEPLPF